MGKILRKSDKKEKQIDGEIYETSWMPMSREFAEKRAYNLRRSGWYARIILMRNRASGMPRFGVFYRRKTEQR